MLLPNMANYLLFFRDDMALSTWILWGAVFQGLLVLVLPRYVAIIPACLMLAGRIVYAMMKQNHIFASNSMNGIIPGKQTFQLPNADGTLPDSPGGKEVTVFIIATRSNHPKGRWAPGIEEIATSFRGMWQEVGRNRDQWGYLGKTPTLIATETDWGNTLVWISYWRSLEDLHRFSRSEIHRAGWEWYNKVQKTHPHIAIQHETYSCPSGFWENIAFNFKPFGIGATKHVIHDEDNQTSIIPPLRPAMTGAYEQSLKSRMGFVKK